MGATLQEFEQPDARPTFITVLCILTFIGSGWGLINDSIKYYTADSQAEVILKVKENASSDISQNRDSTKPGSQFAEMMVGSLNLSPENIKMGALSNGAASIFCLAGAYMMWMLKRKGFYLYVIGTLIGVISPFLIFGTGNFLAIISSAVVGFIGLIFVIMYGVNLKYMN